MAASVRTNHGNCSEPHADLIGEGAAQAASAGMAGLSPTIVRRQSEPLTGINTLVVDSLDGMVDIWAEWSVLRERCGFLTPNADPDRFAATVEAMGDGARPYIATFRDANGPRAMLVGRWSRQRVSYRVGYLKLWSPLLRCVDVVYGGVLTDGRPGSTEMLVRHLKTLLAAGQVDRVAINHLPVNHGMFGQLKSNAKDGRSFVAGGREPHWRFHLVPGSYEQTMGRFSKKHRYNMRRADRLLVERFGGDVRLQKFKEGREIPVFAEGSERIAVRTYQAALAVGFRDTPLWRAILRAEARCGRMRCYWLICGGEPIAFQVGTVYGGTYFLEATGFVSQHRGVSPGTVLLLRVVRDLCGSGVHSMDYGFGDAPYKRLYGTSSVDEVSVRLYGHRLRAQVARIMDGSASRVSGVAERAVRSAGWLGLIKKTWRRCLEAGGRS